MKDFGSRLQVIGLLPTILAVSVVAFLIAADAPEKNLSWLSIQATVVSIGGAGALVISAVSVAIAVSLQPLQFRLVQLMEGYWPAWFPEFLFRLGVWFELRRRDRIRGRIASVPSRNSDAARIAANERSQNAESQIRQRFPAEDRLLPTALGNALRASEDSVGQRYGLESVIIWPRLFHLLPERVRAGMDDEVTQLDVSVRLAVTWTLAGIVSFLWLIRDPAALLEHPLWLAVMIGTLLLARLSYQSAVESAIAQGVDLEVAIDLYRARVIDAMRLHPTVSLDEERRVFGELCELFQTPPTSAINLRFNPAARAGGEPAD
ncbi:hypothetical protein ACFUCV_11940 [Specibacter sp. NPDC057265]|uniref:hypothetical protein n=1 Tax=Specibacter sp. NPDC057265 TaxID=3346075 RepID=UPI003638312E